MVKGDRVRLVNPYVSVMNHRTGFYTLLSLHYRGATGFVSKLDRYGNVDVEWDVPYRGMKRSGMRRAYRFVLEAAAPW